MHCSLLVIFLSKTLIICLPFRLVWVLLKPYARPSGNSLFASNIDDNEDLSYWGLANGHSQFVSGIAIAIGGLIANYLSFNTLFIIMGIVQLMATAVQARLLIKR